MLNLSLENIAYIFIGLVISIIIILILLKSKKSYPYFARGTLLTAAELKFYHVLKSITANQYDISCKVRLGDIINCTNYYWHKGYGPKISAKHIDFVLHNPETSEIILCIELDDKSHSQPDRIKRDKFVNGALNAANVSILHVLVTRGYDMAKLQKDIVIALQ
jgi:hypothetical protein